MIVRRPVSDIEAEAYGKQSRLIREMEDAGRCERIKLGDAVMREERKRRRTAGKRNRWREAK